MRDVGNGLLPLVDRFDEELSAPDLVADIILHFAAVSVLRHDVFVGVADAQVRDLFTVEDDLILAVDFFHGHIRQDVILRSGGKNLTRARIELGDVVRAFLDLLHANSHPARDLGKAPFAQVLHVVLDDFVFEAVSFSFALELDEKTFPQIARADARRIKALDEQQHRLEIFLGDAGVERHFFGGGLEKSIVIDVADDQLRGFAIVGVERRLVELTHEMLLQRFLGGD